MRTWRVLQFTPFSSKLLVFVWVDSSLEMERCSTSVYEWSCRLKSYTVWPRNLKTRHWYLSEMRRQNVRVLLTYFHYNQDAHVNHWPELPHTYLKVFSYTNKIAWYIKMKPFSVKVLICIMLCAGIVICCCMTSFFILCLSSLCTTKVFSILVYLFLINV